MRFRLSPQQVRSFALVALLIAVPVVAYASVVPALAPPGQMGFDKFLHLGTFSVFSALSVLAASDRRRLALLIGLLVVFGGAIEVAQSLVPGRRGSPIDFLADVAGIAIGTSAATYVLLRLRAMGQGMRFWL